MNPHANYPVPTTNALALPQDCFGTKDRMDGPGARLLGLSCLGQLQWVEVYDKDLHKYHDDLNTTLP